MGVVSEVATDDAEKTVPSKKLRLKIFAKKPAAEACQTSEQVHEVKCLKKSPLTDDCIAAAAGDKKINSTLHMKPVIRACKSTKQVPKVNCSENSSDNQTTTTAGNNKLNSVLGTKRSSEGVLECQEGKRLKMDRCAVLNCEAILAKLMNHKWGYPFNNPVDPVLWGINDYFRIIKHPMDLGTIKQKLQQNAYTATDEFEADVRLTFANAMLYNPPGNWVHQYAKELTRVFDTFWKPVKAKIGREHRNIKLSCSENTVRKTIYDMKGKCPESISSRVDKLPRKVTLQKEKGSGDLKEVSVKVQHDDLKAVKDQKPKDSKSSKPDPHFTRRILSVHKESICPKSAKVKRENAPRKKILQNEFNAAEVKNTTTFQMSRSDQDSDGAANCGDEEPACASFPAKTGSLSAATKGLETVLDIELSPSKALRAARLKRRFADTIQKAKTILQLGGITDKEILQHEKNILERQHEEKAGIEAQSGGAQSAARLKFKSEHKRQLQQAREEARITLEKMERSVDLDDNFHVLRDLEALIGSSLVVVQHGSRSCAAVWSQVESNKLRSPLERLGLYIKDEYMAGDDDDDDEGFLQDDGVLEEGEVVF